MRSAYLIAALILLLCAQAPGQKRTKSSPRVPQPSFDVVQIDPGSKQLPRGYRGIDPQLLYEEFEKRSKEAVKGEFETTGAFKARLEAMEAKPLVGTITKAMLVPVAISKESDIFDKVSTLYDADKNELAVNIEMEAPIIGVGSEFDKRLLPLKYVFRPLQEPYFRQGFTSHKPTVLEPKDTLGVYQYLVGDVEQFWFYDYSTGKIYAKLLPHKATTPR